MWRSFSSAAKIVPTFLLAKQAQTADPVSKIHIRTSVFSCQDSVIDFMSSLEGNPSETRPSLERQSSGSKQSLKQHPRRLKKNEEIEKRGFSDSFIGPLALNTGVSKLMFSLD